MAKKNKKKKLERRDKRINGNDNKKAVVIIKAT